MELQIRQGDILLRKIAPPEDYQYRSLEKHAAKQGACRITLAVGEATGHAHVLEAEGGSILTQTPAGRMLLYIAATGRLQHEDHGQPRDATGNAVEIPAGWWEVHRKREYTPAGRSRLISD